MDSDWGLFKTSRADSLGQCAPHPAVAGIDPQALADFQAGIRKRYGALDVQRGVDLTVGVGSWVTVIGPTGAGHEDHLGVGRMKTGMASL